MAGSRFPERQMLPEQLVEAPDHSRTAKRKWLEIDTFFRSLCTIGDIVQGADEFRFQRLVLNLPQVHADFNPGQNLFASNGSTQRNGFTKICFVLHPVQMDVQVFQKPWLYLAIAGSGHERGSDTGSQCSLFRGNMLDVKNHQKKTRTALYTT